VELADALRFQSEQITQKMSGIALQLEHTVEADVTAEFAWKYRTDIATWNDPPARFALDGAFIEGSRGTTELPEQQPLHWKVREVQPSNSFVLEMELDRAIITFEWRFDALSEQRTRMTQKIVLAGENAAAYVEQIRASFSPGLADGMRRIAADMAAAQRRSKNGV
jgi:hypothetical protein